MTEDQPEYYTQATINFNCNVRWRWWGLGIQWAYFGYSHKEALPVWSVEILIGPIHLELQKYETDFAER